MSTLEAIRSGIAARLETLDGLRVGQEWGDKINVSGSAVAAVVEYAGTTYDAVMDGQGDLMTFKVTLLASKVSDRAGRQKLDALLDPDADSTTSVRNAVNGSLAGLVAFATVTSATGYGEYEVGSGDAAAAYLGCELTVQVAT